MYSCKGVPINLLTYWLTYLLCYAIETDPDEHACRSRRNGPLQHHSARSHSRITLYPHGARSVFSHSFFHIPVAEALQWCIRLICAQGRIKTFRGLGPKYFEGPIIAITCMQQTLTGWWIGVLCRCLWLDAYAMQQPRMDKMHNILKTFLSAGSLKTQDFRP